MHTTKVSGPYSYPHPGVTDPIWCRPDPLALSSRRWCTALPRAATTEWCPVIGCTCRQRASKDCASPQSRHLDKNHRHTHTHTHACEGKRSKRRIYSVFAVSFVIPGDISANSCQHFSKCTRKQAHANNCELSQPLRPPALTPAIEVKQQVATVTQPPWCDWSAGILHVPLGV